VVESEPTHVIELGEGKVVEYYPWGVVKLVGFVSKEEIEEVYKECKLGQGGAYER